MLILTFSSFQTSAFWNQSLSHTKQATLLWGRPQSYFFSTNLFFIVIKWFYHGYLIFLLVSKFRNKTKPSYPTLKLVCWLGNDRTSTSQPYCDENVYPDIEKKMRPDLNVSPHLYRWLFFKSNIFTFWMSSFAKWTLPIKKEWAFTL